MLLAIDIGNTHITIGLWNGRSWQEHWRLATVREKTADEYGVLLLTLLREANLATAVSGVILCSVVPPLTSTFTQMFSRYLNQTAVQVGLQMDLGIQVNTDNPAQVGMDRLVNAAAAYHRFVGPSIILDMGTATKFDVVTANGEFIGGAIAPGIQLAADALYQRAAQLSQVGLQAPPQVIGRNTIHAMQSGLVFGYVSLIERMIERIKAEHPDRDQPIPVLGTGGLISLITAHTAVIDTVDPWLTLSGLCQIYDRNKHG